jgi:Lamin Tail Domain
MSKDVQGQEDASQYTVRFGEPALRVTAELVMSDVIPVDSRERVMDLGFESTRGNFTIAGLTFEKLGTASQYRISVFDGLQVMGYSNGATLTFEPALEIKEGYGKQLSVYVEMDGGEISSSFGLSLNATGIDTTSGPATVDEIQVSNKVAYFSEVPHSVVIDGAFADWRYGYIMTDNANDVRLADGSLINDPSIDITGYGMYIDQKDVAMYLSVADRICNGTSIPKNITIPVPTQGLPNPAGQQLIGADIAGVLLDTDLDPSTGASFSGTLGADYLVFISGKKGKIIQSELYAWDTSQGNATWRFVEKVRSAVDSKRMEFAFNFSALSMGDLDVAAVSFFMTDWKQATDFSDGILPLAKWQIGMYSKAFGGILINEIYNNKGTTDWIEFYNTGTLPITLTNWVIYDGITVIYIFGPITINPGGLYVVTGLSISKEGNLRLSNAGGTLIDSVSYRENGNPKTFARTGAPPYSTWKDLMPPSPGAVNPGQVPIPEFSDILIPLTGMIGMFIFMRMRRRKVKDG